MKRIGLSLILILFLSQILFAQGPAKFKYQAVIRNLDGSVISNQQVSIQITLLNEGNAIYVETHSTPTNDYGVVNIEIGGGEIELGDFSLIDWSNGPYFIQLGLDMDGGMSFVVLGSSQLLSVPYALHANTVEFDLVEDDDSDSLNEIQTLKINGTKLSITKGDTVDLATSFIWKNSETKINYSKGDVEIGAPISPQATFTVSNENVTIGFTENVSVADFQRTHSGSTSRLMFYVYPDVSSLLHLKKSAMVYATGDAESLVLAAAQPLGNIKFFTQSTFYASNERMRIDENGNVGIGTTAPSYKLDVDGTINATNLLINGAPIAFPAKWDNTDGGISYSTGNVGIGTTTPNYKLEVDGTINAANLLINGAPISFPVKWDDTTGGISYSTGNVAVGTPISPQATFTVSNENPTIGFTENVSVADFQRTHSGSTSRLMFYVYPDVSSLLHLKKSAMVYATGDAESLVLAAAQPLGNIKFFTQSTFFASNERMRIDENGNVGIGTTAPSYKLDVDGTINAANLLINGTPIAFPAKWDDTSGGISYSIGNVTVGTPISPQATFTVSNENPTIGFTENVSVADFQRTHSGSTSRLMFYVYPDVSSLLHLKKSAMVYATGDAESLVLAAAQPLGNIRFFTQSTFFASNERMRIDENGNVGIGTTAPKSKLQISTGDVYIEDINSGVIMKSPDGSCWRLTIDNTGAIITSSISCPN